MSERNFSNIHALVIGVDRYISEHHLNLDGCVSDATSIADYLVETLGVPDHQVQRLFNERATRDRIREAFWRLTRDPNIKPLDPIFIFFAGHGGRLDAPKEMHSTDDKYELILPHDADTNGPDGSYIYGIPDRTLAAMIYTLFKEKGDNITVVLDSCFSGSSTRGRVKARFSQNPAAPPIPATLDQDIVQNLPQAKPKPKSAANAGSRRTLAPSLNTHVLLAACQNHEFAQEIECTDPATQEPRSSGLFTYALLKALQGCNPATTSYAELMRAVLDHINRFFKNNRDLGGQVPQCEGRNKERLLFNTQFAMSKGMIQLLPTTKTNVFRIKAGHASGIQVGTELGVYSGTMSGDSAPLTRLVAQKVLATESTLGPREPGAIVEVPRNAYVVVTKFSDQAIRMLVQERSALSNIWDEVFRNLEALPIDIVYTEPGEPSDLVLQPTKTGALLQRTDPSLIQLEPGNITLKNEVGVEKLTQQMDAIIRFHFHLQRRNPDSPLKGHVGMHLVELQSQPDGDYRPASNHQDLFGDSLVTGAAVVLKNDPDKAYGLILTNQSNWPLYAYVLYFDLEDYSISCFYSPPSRTMDAPLSNSGKEFGIGYGSSGAEPLRVELGANSKKDSGLFVMLVSSTWVEISHIEQLSPFEEEEARVVEERNTAKLDTTAWDVLVVGVNTVP